MGFRGVVIQGFDLFDVDQFMKDKKNKFLAITLSDLEQIMSVDPASKDRPEEFYLIRKLILDMLNNYDRSIRKIIIGPVEDENYT